MATGGRQVQNIVARLLGAMALSSLTICALWIAPVVLTVVRANTTYRVGQQVLVVGDGASRVSALLGKPQSISRGTHKGGRLPGQNTKRRHRGGQDRKGSRSYPSTQWHYRLGSRHVIVTFVSGKVVDIASGR